MYRPHYKKIYIYIVYLFTLNLQNNIRIGSFSIIWHRSQNQFQLKIFEISVLLPLIPYDVYGSGKGCIRNQ